MTARVTRLASRASKNGRCAGCLQAQRRIRELEEVLRVVDGWLAGLQRVVAPPPQLASPLRVMKGGRRR